MGPLLPQTVSYPPSHEVPDAIAPKSLAQVDPHWESLSKVKEVTAPTIIEFKTYEREELDPSTSKIVRTHVIYPIITPKESDCISIPPLSEAKGQVNLLVPSPLAMKLECKDGITSTITTLREPPASDQTEPVPAELTRDVADFDGAASPPHQMPTPPRQPSVLRTPSTLLLTRDFLDSPRKEISDLPRFTPAQSSASPDVLPSSRASSCFSSGEGTEREEGQFDDAEESDVGDSPQLHPCEQPLPPSPSPSPAPSPELSRVNQLVQRILETRCSVSDDQAVSPDMVVVVPDCPVTSPCPDKQDADDVTPMDTSVQGEPPSVLPTAPPNQLPPLKYTLLPPNAGRGTLIKQLFAPRGAFTAPRMVRPPPVTKKPARELIAPEPLTLPPLLPRTHIRPMTIDYGHLSSPSPAPLSSVDTPIQAALDQVTSSQAKLSTPFDQPVPKELTLPAPYSTPLPRTSPIMPILDKVSAGSPPLPMDSENDLLLNSIPVAELRNTFLTENTSLMPVLISGPGLQKPGTAVKLLVSTPKPPRRHYGWSRNQQRRAAHAKA